MLGYSYAQHTTRSHFGVVSDTFSMDEVQCTGNEASILDCPHLTVEDEDCSAGEGAGVICSNYPDQTIENYMGECRASATAGVTDDNCNNPGEPEYAYYGPFVGTCCYCCHDNWCSESTEGVRFKYFFLYSILLGGLFE